MDFPFQSHGTPKEGLKAVWDSIETGEMPPQRYQLMHPGAHLSKEDKEKVRTWVRESLKML
jgi:hypothetical protein